MAWGDCAQQLGGNVNTQAHRTSRTIAKIMSVLGAVVLAAGLLSVGGYAAPAQAAPAEQCNAGDGDGGGVGIECDVTITNLYDVSTGIGSSTVRTIRCIGGANTARDLLTCTDSGIIAHAELTNVVTQCNASVGGTGGSLHCRIYMTNTIVGAATTSAATVNQCNGSLGGGGIVPGSVCDPTPATTDGADITQCNGSVNGGGGYMVCEVGTSTANSAFPVTINQCNGSAEGAGNTMTCGVQITTVVQPADDDENGGGDTGGDSGTPDELAATGAGAVPLALTAAVVLLLGGLLTLRARRSALD